MKSIVKNNKMIITMYSIITILFLLMIAFNNKGLYLIFPIGKQELFIYFYYACVFFSIFFIFNFYKKNPKLYKSTMSYILLSIFLFFIPQFIYTSVKYNLTINDYFTTAIKYFFIVWSFPILYLISKDNGYEKILKKINFVVILGYISILGNAILKNYFAFSLFKVMKWAIKDGKIRLLNLSAFMPLVLIYNWNKIINNEAKKKNWISLIILLLVTVYVEQTRFQIIAIAATMALMYLFKKRKSMKNTLLYFITILLIILSLASGWAGNYISQFSEEKNGISTSYRMNELNFYLERFNKNKLFGIGLIPQDKIYSIYRISSYGDMNPDDIGIFGSLGVIGSGVVLLFIIPMIRWFSISKKVLNTEGMSKDGTLLMGMFIYLLVSSITLFVLNFQRIPLFPFCIAIFEYYNYLLKNRGDNA